MNRFSLRKIFFVIFVIQLRHAILSDINYRTPYNRLKLFFVEMRNLFLRLTRNTSSYLITVNPVMIEARDSVDVNSLDNIGLFLLALTIAFCLVKVFDVQAPTVQNNPPLSSGIKKLEDGLSMLHEDINRVSHKIVEGLNNEAFTTVINNNTRIREILLKLVDLLKRSEDQLADLNNLLLNFNYPEHLQNVQVFYTKVDLLSHSIAGNMHEIIDCLTDLSDIILHIIV